MRKDMIIKTFFGDKKEDKEHVSSAPSLTDSSAYEPLSVMVNRIIRGELSPYALARSNARLANDRYDFDGNMPPDDLFDRRTEITDLTDFDEIYDMAVTAPSAMSPKDSVSSNNEAVGCPQASDERATHKPSEERLPSGQAASVQSNITES